MKCAADFREIARNALRGRWAVAVIACLIAVLLGGTGNEGVRINLNVSNSGANIGAEIAGQNMNPEARAILFGGIVVVVIVALVITAIHLFLGGVVGIGHARFNLELIDRGEVECGLLFQYFAFWKNAVCARLLKEVYIILWSLLLIVPGIIANYRYSMTEYILAEHPEMTAREALAASKEMMSGNKWRLFCLDLSFIGWTILCGFTLGIGNLWLNPYKKAATAAFYREISGTEQPALNPAQDDFCEWNGL